MRIGALSLLGHSRTAAIGFHKYLTISDGFFSIAADDYTHDEKRCPVKPGMTQAVNSGGD
jgi:hypothetical protein